MITSTGFSYSINFKALATAAVAFAVVMFSFCSSYAYDTYDPRRPFSKKLTKNLEEQAEKINKKVLLLWDLESSAESYSSEIDNAFFFQFKSSGILKYQFMERVKLDLKANVFFQGGQAQSRFDNLLPQGPAFLSYGFIDFDVLGNDLFSFKAGALAQQEVFGSYIFISHRSFPGISETISYEADNIKLKLSAQQVIPTTFTFSTALIEREKTPTLNTGNISATYESDLVSFKLTGGLFDYSNLPAFVADVSDLYGNSIEGTNLSSRFIYEFSGWMAGFKTFYNPTKSTTFVFNLNMLENTEAPKTFNQSQVIQISAEHRLNKFYSLDISATDFFVESDAVPAFFTSRTFGQTNRRGYSFEAGIQWLEKKVRLSAAYTISNLINPDQTQRQLDNDVISISLETAYDLFN